MAAGSLGRLTLDLAVRLSEFTDGLSRAERETRERTENMGASVRSFRDRMMEDLGGTQLGGIIDSLNSRLGSISGGGMMAGAAIAGMAVGGVAVATGALVSMALETAKADVQLQVMANTANVGLRSFQVLTHAAAGLGVEQDALASILADVQEKLGEFSATGGGGAADFFEALQNNTQMTDEEIRNLGKTLQGKDGAEAIQLIKDKMDELGATSQEQRFVFESLAGDLGNLMPLFADGGEILNKYGKELEDAGVIKTDAAIEQSRRLTAQTQAVTTQFDGFKTQLAAQMMPVLNSLIGYFVDGRTKGGQFGTVMESVGLIAKVVGAGIIGVAGGIKLLVRMIQAFGEQVANVGITTSNFFAADGFMEKAQALKNGYKDYYNINARLGADFVNELSTIKKAITGTFTPATGKLTGLAGAYYDASGATNKFSKGLAVNTVEADANAKALEKQAAAAAKSATANKKAASSSAKASQLLKEYVVGGKSYTTVPAGKYGAKRGYGGHAGLDLSTPRNTQVYAPEGGKYTFADTPNGGGGRIATLVGDSGMKYRFLHLEATSVSSGSRVEMGSPIAKTGNSGKRASGKPYDVHLHMEVYDSKGKRLDPTNMKVNGSAKQQVDVASIYDAENREAEQAAKEAQRQQEDILRRQNSITAKYATDREKIESEHAANVAEIKDLYAEGSTERAELLAREELEYIENKNAAATSILVKYLSGEAKLKYDHEQALKAIEMANIEDDEGRQALINKQNAAYQEDLENFRFAANAKAREQDKLYRSIAASMRDNVSLAASDGLDRMAQRTMSADDYAVWRLAQDHDESFNSVNSQYADRQSEINARDDRGDFLLPELERNELLEIARQEHLDALWAMEEDHALKQQTLDEQLADKRLSIQSSAFSAMTSVAGMFFGENSRMQRAAFALEKAYAVNKALMNVKETYSNTFNAISAIPLIGPYIAMPAAAAASALQIAQAASIKGMSAPTVSGIAHGGLDYVPKESTYLLDEGERVLSPRQNKDLAAFMAKGNQSNNGNITINNNSNAEVSARRAPNGEVTIEMVDKMIEKSFRRIGQPNSIESKSIQRGTTARVNRR